MQSESIFYVFHSRDTKTLLLPFCIGFSVRELEIIIQTVRRLAVKLAFGLVSEKISQIFRDVILFVDSF